MDLRKNTATIAALLGVVLGVLLTMTVTSIVNGGKRKVSYGDWKKLKVILQEVEKNYVDTVDEKGVTDAAVTAALASLDPHSIYLPPVELETSETELAGNFDGIGIQFNVPNDTAIVLEVIPGGPSEKVGLQQGDRLISVDTTVIAGVRFPQDSMVRRMKGPSGTKVRVTVNRDGEIIPFEITRGKIPVHSVVASFMVDDTTGYIKLSSFSRNTFSEVYASSQGLLEKGMKHLIFDLRGNTGGYFDQALLLCDMFLEKGNEIVYLEGLHRKREDYKASGKGIMKDVGLSVLIDESTASSSEIFSGAIQDNDRGVIVGRRSFGKGLVQEPIYFTDGSGIRITVARFYTPSGRCIQKPYSPDYRYDIYNRYAEGEMYDRDSIKIDSTAEFHTVGGRVVYGGGGIIPDVFVPVDTTKVTDFMVGTSKRATLMRYASQVFDEHKAELASIDDFRELERFLDRIGVESGFLRFAASRDGLSPVTEDKYGLEHYIYPQVRALVGRYSKLGDNAFYRMYLQFDEAVEAARKTPDRIVL